MNRIFLPIVLVLLACMSACADKSRDKTPNEVVRVDTMSTMLMSIQRCSRLYTTEYHIHKVITHDDELALKGRLAGHDYNVALPLGKRKIAIPVDATIKAYIDFSSFTEQNVRHDTSHVEIILPDPRIVLTSSRVDHSAIKEYVAMTRRNFSDEELSAYERQGRDAIITDIASTDIFEQARISAANTLIPMLKALGYKEENIMVTFAHDFSSANIMRLIDNSSIENAKRQ